MTYRPNMRARDASGKQVSLLNDDSSPAHEMRPVFGNPHYGPLTSMARSESNHSGVSTASSPRTPNLQRSDSYDSQTTNESGSPITPVFMTDYERQPQYATAGFFKAPASQYEERTYEYLPPYANNQQYSIRQAYPESRTSPYAESQYDEDAYHQGSDRGTKRYPCRYRDTHHCEKTFTTSGHASRHSKIHTAEKAVHCTHQGCQKKFTRADNMKQHLETHYKSKNGAAQKSSSRSSLTATAGVKKSVLPSRSSRPASSSQGPAEYSSYDPALYAGSATERYAHAIPTGSPIAPYGSLDVLANIAALQS